MLHYLYKVKFLIIEYHSDIYNNNNKTIAEILQWFYIIMLNKRVLPNFNYL